MLRGRRYLAVGALALMAIAAAACGGSDESDGSGGGGTPGGGSDKDAPVADEAATADEAAAGGGDEGEAAVDPCAIVTGAEIEGVLGTGPVAEGVLNGAVCGWPVGVDDAGRIGDFGTVAISVTDTTQFTSTAEEGVATAREGFGAAAVEITGLGDEAVADGAGMLAFRTGDWYMTVGVYAEQDPASNQAAAETLAHMVVDRL